MPKILQKSLQECLSKIKNPNPSKNWILPSCKYPKSPSFGFNRSHNLQKDQKTNLRDGAATLSDVDRFLLENFKSLYINNDNIEEEEEEKEKSYHFDDSPKVVYDSPKSTFELPPDLISSHRFFVAAGSSSSLIEEARSSLATTTTTVTSSSSEGGRPSSSNSTLSNNTLNPENSVRKSNGNDNGVLLPEDCIAVVRYSISPSDDFRRSMQEMVESRIEREGKVDWEFMQELLYCFLDLNEEKSHKYILNAFVDIVVGLRQRSDQASPTVRSRRRSRSGAIERRRKSRNVT